MSSKHTFTLPPKFVRMTDPEKSNHSGTCLRLVKDKYYRDGGCWEVGYKHSNGLLLTTSSMPELCGKVLTEVSEKEWRADNGMYAPDDPYWEEAPDNLDNLPY